MATKTKMTENERRLQQAIDLLLQTSGEMALVAESKRGLTRLRLNNWTSNLEQAQTLLKVLSGVKEAHCLHD